jgi:hypothetical protein
MKVMLDACAIDWLLDDPSSAAFLTCIQGGKLDAFVSADVLSEVNCTPLKKGDRRQRLLGIAFSKLKIASTAIPIVGGRPTSATTPLRPRNKTLSIVALPSVISTHSKLLSLGIKKLDGVHLVEAGLANAAFITTDKADLLRKRSKIKKCCGVECLSPEELLKALGC